jgi:aromatic-L-amino-acid/L-tryptophan decarboxylase
MSDSSTLPRTGDMPSAEFRENGAAVLEWIARYLETVGDYPVGSSVRPGDVLAALPETLPERGEPFSAMLYDFEKTIVPGITHWNHPGFLAYFPSCASGPGILGEWLAAALGVNAMLWTTSPSATELERRALSWLAGLLGLPDSFTGLLYDTASVGTLHAIAAGREAAGAGNVREEGLAGTRPMTLYASELAHSSVEKAAITLGIGSSRLRKIPADGLGRMDVGTLAARIREDRDGGRVPFCVVATAGTTTVTSVDPLREIAAVCRSENLWMHVDAAYAGAAAALPEMRDRFDGWDLADSIVVNPHKWLFTPMDCSAFFTRRSDVLRRAFSLVPDYLKTGGSEDNLMDYGVQLGRRFRGLKLWFVLRYFGREGIQNRLREHIRIARHFAGWIDEHPDFERTAPAPFSTVCFRAAPPAVPEEELDGLNERLLRAANASGECFLSHARVGGQFCLRLAVGNIRTEERHVLDVWALLQHELGRLLASATAPKAEDAGGRQ